ncbi:LacI family DNA-binding transcriptional regulator [Hutsoniella sourekii]|uniref:LacI family DNA-binding transcriptional regulator n=1 Tax=Hutsoniella sourekii TaxID=87650 RepID=UPI0004883CBC|nr:LacI family DNA-binding transcriptional regulator [Hutsoniella sourekii]
MTTLNDIARLAGVSKSTVSRYLNKGQVSQATSEKIKEIIEQTGYQPNSFARSLKASKTRLIGVVVPRFNSSSISDVLDGIDQVAVQHDRRLLIVNSNLDPQVELDQIQALDRENVDGMIVLTRNLQAPLLEIDQSLSAQMLILGQAYPDLNYISYDDYHAGSLIGRHALDLGHREFVYINSDRHDVAVGQVRLQGFLDTIQEAGANCQVVESTFLQEDNYQLALKILPQLQASFLLAATDRMAIAIIKAASHLGLSVPGDLSVAGFGGYSDGLYLNPSLTTVHYPYRQAGRQAMEALLQLTDKEQDNYQTSLPVELVKRESTQKFDPSSYEI